MSIQKALQWRTQTLLTRVREARVSVNHQGLYGENNEGLLIEALRELLPMEWELGSGEIVDVDGAHSPQCDIIIYNRHTLAPAYVSPTGRVAVLAHAVGGVIEVKSLLHSGPEVAELCEQTASLQRFLTNAMTRGRDEVLREADEQDVDETVKVELDRICTESHVWGFAYGADIQFDTIKDALPLREGVAQVFALDVPRAWTEIQELYNGLGDTPTKDAVMEFAERIRQPNGFSFSVEPFNQEGQATLVATAWTHGSDALRVLVKEVSDLIRRRSPLQLVWSPKAAEVVYSAYHPWKKTYE
ncbi:DUF6602 domain-containing protein [Sorangium sp. So ce128]|uniref:DUF6602 domain-containing protein n=1 Tax=Sorangium sp. So ce128 TaxID=3133281 RepID=UPI003F604327